MLPYLSPSPHLVSTFFQFLSIIFAFCPEGYLLAVREDWKSFNKPLSMSASPVREKILSFDNRRSIDLTETERLTADQKRIECEMPSDSWLGACSQAYSPVHWLSFKSLFRNRKINEKSDSETHGGKRSFPRYLYESLWRCGNIIRRGKLFCKSRP